MKNLLIGMLALTSISTLANIGESLFPEDIIDIIKKKGRLESGCELKLNPNPYDIGVSVRGEYHRLSAHSYYENMQTCKDTSNGFYCGTKHFSKWGSGASTRHHFICSKTSLELTEIKEQPVLKFRRIIYEALMNDLWDHKNCNAAEGKVEMVELEQYRSEEKTIRVDCNIID